MMEGTDVVEEFYGVYLLRCLNPKFKGRTYIGYTVDPNRRIKQHNKGKQYGGAWRTSAKGPWEMVLTVHGFPSDVAALRFEWAWQHPKRSRRLKSLIPNKKASESSFDYNLKIMFTMLTVAPWRRLPLTIRWLSAEVMVQAPPNLCPPVHMPIVYGPVKSEKLKSLKKNNKKNDLDETDPADISLKLCRLCKDLINEEDVLVCLNSTCQTSWHVLCLAKNFLDEEKANLNSFSSQLNRQLSNHVLPVEGSCPKCNAVLLWGDLIRKKKGCYSQIKNVETDDLNLDSN